MRDEIDSWKSPLETWLEDQKPKKLEPKKIELKSVHRDQTGLGENDLGKRTIADEEWERAYPPSIYGPSTSTQHEVVRSIRQKRDPLYYEELERELQDKIARRAAYNGYDITGRSLVHEAARQLQEKAQRERYLAEVERRRSVVDPQFDVTGKAHQLLQGPPSSLALFDSDGPVRVGDTLVRGNGRYQIISMSGGRATVLQFR